MRYVGYGLILMIALLIETGGAPGLSLFGVRPELLSLLTMLFTMSHGSQRGAVFGFSAGLMHDLLIGRFIGLYASVLLLLGAVIGFITEQLFKDNFLVRLGTVFAGTALSQVLYFLGMAAFGRGISWLQLGWQSVLAASVLNTLLSLFLYRPMLILDKRLNYWHELLKRTG